MKSATVVSKFCSLADMCVFIHSTDIEISRSVGILTVVFCFRQYSSNSVFATVVPTVLPQINTWRVES